MGARNAEHNAQNLGFTLGENQFSDLTQEQYRVAAGLGYKAPETMNGLPHLGVHEHGGEELAASVNWVTAGAVTPIKDQGQCGSCWAFSTTGSTEGAWQIGSGNLLSVSEQQLVDCATATSSGCQGGSMAGAIQYESGTAMATEASYPYTATDGTCKSSFTAAIPDGGVTGYKSVGSYSGASKSDMQSAVQQQPISIAIEADQYAFQAYQSGILSSGCGTSLDHGVLAVGYGTESGQDYWLVKNSWGTSWGMDGYIKISSDSNVCGVLSQPVYPEVNASPGPAPAPTPPAPTPPAPAPTPPAPSPTPSEGDCVLQDTEDDCNSIVQGGLPCRWCYLQYVGEGICLEPDDTFDDCAAIFYRRQQQKAAVV